MSLLNKIVFFDLETTGLDTFHDRIIQAVFVKVTEDRSKHVLRFYFNPQIPITKEASEVHGYTDKSVKDFPVMTDKDATEILNFIKGYHIAGFNSNNFDVPFLINTLNRFGKTLDTDGRCFIDVSNIYRQHFPRTLAHAYGEYTGLLLENAHDALYDVEATIEIFKQQLEHPDTPTNEDIKELETYSNYGKQRADIMGKFTYNDNGCLVFNFGKHNGEVVNNNHLSYLSWMAKQDFHSETQNYVMKAINQAKKVA